MNRKDKFEKDIELKHNYSKYKKHHKMNSHYNNQDKNKKDLIEKKDDNFIKRIMSSISQKIDSIAGLEEINSINNEKNNEEVKNHPKHIKKEKNIPPKYNKENFNIEKKHEKNIVSK